ncbi:MAG: hypothetical protein CSA65_01575 [Proteobacteria bacterium]|nr:MAG: hypothetical protein CSA65_01575 [Pseudomonadota bacterium]
MIISLLTALTLVVWAGCGDKKAGKGKKAGPAKNKPVKAKGEIKATKAKGKGGGLAEKAATAPWNTASVLEWAPASAKTLIAIRDLGELYKILDAVKGSVAAMPTGAKLLEKARQFTARLPVPLPWTAAELSKLGLDPKGTVAVIGKRRHAFVLLPLSDLAAFREAAGKIGSWSKTEVSGLTFHKLTPKRDGKPANCYFAGKRAICTNDPEAAATWIKEAKRHDPVAKHISPAQKAQIEKSTAFLWVSDRKADVFATAKVAADGVAVQADLSSPAFAQATRMLGPTVQSDPQDSPLLGLAAGSTSRAYLRLPFQMLAQLWMAKSMGRSGPSKGPLGGLLQQLSNFTGEVLALERPGGELAIIAGARDQAKTRQLVTTLGKLAEAQLKQTKKNKNVKITLSKKTIAGGPGYRLQVRAQKPVPLTFDWGIAAGKLGLVIGSLKTVETIAATEKADAKAFLATLTAEDRAVYKKGTIAGLQLAVGDPLAGIAGSLEQALPSRIGSEFGAALTLGRFLFDQMDHISFGQAQIGPQKLRIVASAHTLHRTGNAADDAARKLWHTGLQAKLAGDAATFEKTLLELAEKYPKTRYAKLKERQKGALFTTIAGVFAAIAIPAFHKYIRRTKAMEGWMNTQRIATMARMALMQEKLKKGKTPWTPAKPCCKNAQGTCVGGAAFEKGAWKALGFKPGPRSYFQYRYAFDGKKLTIEARSDFDCNGVYGTFKLEGTVDGRRFKMKPLETKDQGE